MTVADMKAAVALAVEQAMRLVQSDDAVAVAEPPKRAKRTLSPEQKAKMAAGRAKAKAAKAAPAKPVKAAKAVAESASRDDGVILKAGGVEVVAYDGGVVLRAPGRRRGIPFRKGDWKLFAAFCNTLRSTNMDAIQKAVAKQIG